MLPSDCLGRAELLRRGCPVDGGRALARHRNGRPAEDVLRVTPSCLAGRHLLSRDRLMVRPISVEKRFYRAVTRKGGSWPTLSWSAPSGGTRARERSSTGCPSRPTSSSASRAATMPAIRWSSTAIPTSCRCCRRAWFGRASCRSSATAWCSIRRHCWRRSTGFEGQGVAVTPDSLRIAENATLILPLHQQLDVMRANPRAPAKWPSAPPAAASARPMKTRSAAAPSA